MNRVAWAAALGVALPGSIGPAVAQEALFNSVAGQQRTEQTRSQLESTPYTFRVKDLRVVVTPSVGVEWNDNVRLAENDAESDVIFTPRLDLHALYPLGERNRLNLDVGVGYSKYLEADDLDQLIITPGSILNLAFGIGDVEFNVYDRLSYQLDPTLVGAVAGTGSFGGIENTAGTSAVWALNKLSFTLGYDFLKWISEEDFYSYMDRSTHSGLFRAGYQIHPTTTVGLESTVATTIYDDSYLNDSTGYSVGAYAQIRLSETFSVAPRGGYSLYTFSENAFLGDPSDYASYYFGLQLTHRPNETVTYNLSADRQTKPGVDANLTDIYNATLAATWSFIRDLPITTSVYYEYGKQTAGGLIETWDRYGASIGVSREIIRRLTGSLSYTFTYRDSDFANRDYLQNRVMLSFSYRL